MTGRRFEHEKGIAFALSIPVSIVRAAVFAKLWEWFVADVFGVHAVSVAEAFGLTLLYTVLSGFKPDDDADDLLVGVLASLFLALLYLGAGLLLVGVR